MKKIVLKDAVISPGMEYVGTSYPGDGVYWLSQRNQIAVVVGFSCMTVNIAPSMIVEENEKVGRGGPSEEFVLALIDKTAELVKFKPARSVRKDDAHDSAFEGI